jgi:hypothetical protein
VARKTANPEIASAVEDFQALSLVKYEMALAAYELQDAETRGIIDRIVVTLGQYATGALSIAGTEVQIDNEYLGYELLYLAVEITKDLAFLGIRVANFTFPQTLCAGCGAELKGGKNGA